MSPRAPARLRFVQGSLGSRGCSRCGALARWRVGHRRAGGCSQSPVASTSQRSVKVTVLGAGSVGYSTGPSGVQLMKLFERWGIADEIARRTVQAPPGVPVGTLVARGEVALGFQQLSELMHLSGITVLGGMPEGCAIDTTFSAGLCSAATQAQAASALIAYLRSPDTAELKRRHGMAPA